MAQKTDFEDGKVVYTAYRVIRHNIIHQPQSKWQISFKLDNFVDGRTYNTIHTNRHQDRFYSVNCITGVDLMRWKSVTRVPITTCSSHIHYNFCLTCQFFHMLSWLGQFLSKNKPLGYVAVLVTGWIPLLPSSQQRHSSIKDHVIGVGAQSTLGGTKFLPEKYVWKIIKIPNFFLNLPEKCRNFT